MVIPKLSNHSRGSRLDKLHSAELVKLSGDNLQAEFRDAGHLIQINFAHIIMLKEQELISCPEAQILLRCLRQIENEGAEKVISIDLRVGDIVTCFESYIIDKTGIECGGKINTGRSRNDIFATLAKMDLKDAVLRIVEELIDLEQTLLKMSQEHLKTVMPGYTHHSRHAQPITLGYYFLGNFDVFQRDLQRLKNLWPLLNSCPMGSAALATTGFPLNRERVAELLGFESIHEHAYDAISSKDFILEFLFIMAAISSDMGRMAENLLLWSTFEYSMLDLADEYTSFSSIMPQKKNAVALECIRAYNTVVTGKLMNAFGIMKPLAWSNGRETSILAKDYGDTAEKVENMLIMMKGIIKSLIINREVMHRWATQGFSTTTELADTLVRVYGFPFRTAHEIVGLVTKKAIANGFDALGIDANMVEGVIAEHTGKSLSLDPETVKSALDPLNNIKVRNLTGGPAPRELQRMIDQRKIALQKWTDRVNENKSKSERTFNKLSNLVDSVIEGSAV